MGFFDSLTDLIGWTNSNAQDAADSAGLNLGNIFLPGGLQGGSVNETPFAQQQGFGGTPLNEADYNELNRVYGTVSDAANFGDINWGSADSPVNFRGVNFAGNNLSPEAQKFLQNNWGAIRGARQLGDVSWQGVKGSPGYAPLPSAVAPGAGAAPGSPTSTLGDLEPARNAFANLAVDQAGQVNADQLGGLAPVRDVLTNVATSQAGEVDQNAYGNILSLLRQQAAPEEQRAFQGINQNLFSRGRLGAEDSVTGEAYRSFARGQSEADLSRQLSAYGLSDALRTSALGRSLDASQGAAGLTGLSDTLRNSAFARSLGAAQGASGLTQLSTLPFELALKLAGARSGAALGQSNSAAFQNDNILDSWSKFWSFGGSR